MENKLTDIKAAQAAGNQFTEHDLYNMFLEEAHRLTPDREKAQAMAKDALRDFLKWHMPKNSERNNGD